MRVGVRLTSYRSDGVKTDHGRLIGLETSRGSSRKSVVMPAGVELIAR